MNDDKVPPSFPAVGEPAPDSVPLGARAEEEPRESQVPLPKFNTRTNVILFVLTVLSVFFVGAYQWTAREGMGALETWLSAWTFAVPLLAILLAHEFGHYVAARIHRVPASLPYFIPLPIFNPFGTMGAVIIMPRRIRSANALLDIGAAGPIAGMVVAIPVMLLGLSLSEVGPRLDPAALQEGQHYVQEGQSILYWALKTAVFGRIGPDQDVLLHPTALAAWVGFFVTFLNMIPVGQLDGGHIAFALFGKRQNRFAQWFRHTPLALLVYNLLVHAPQALERGLANSWMTLTSSSLMWVFAIILLRLMGRYSGFGHPPVDDEKLSPVRRVVAVATLAMLISLFMPSPWVMF